MGAPNAAGRDTPGRKCRVLIVEDDSLSSMALRRLIVSLGHEVAVAGTLEEAERKLPRAGCVVLDLHLPDGNGIDLLRSVRRRRLPVRVAVTTGSAGEDLLAEVQSLRPDALFIKPFHPPDLFDWLGSS